MMVSYRRHLVLPSLPPLRAPPFAEGAVALIALRMSSSPFSLPAPGQPLLSRPILLVPVTPYARLPTRVSRIAPATTPGITPARMIYIDH